MNQKTKQAINPSELDFKYAETISEAVGNTPLVKLRKIIDSPANIFVKLEFMNPTGSVKDRMAIHILQKAVKRGDLRAGGTIIEATSGNTGAAVAMFAAANGYKAILTIPDKMSNEKIDTLKAFGAEVIVCPTAVPPDDPRSYYETAKDLFSKTDYAYFMGQYHNLDNIEAHYQSTGPEIWRQTNGKITMLVGGIGTGGTVSGTGKYLKEQNPNMKVIAVDVEGSVYYDHFKNQKSIEPHPYLVEGIGDDMLCPTTDFSVFDDVVQVSDPESFDAALKLARTEGILSGGSSGSALAGLMQIVDRLTEDDIVVVILPDGGLKYLSKFYSEKWLQEKGFSHE